MEEGCRKEPLVRENPISDKEMMKGEEPIKSKKNKSTPLKSTPKNKKNDEYNNCVIPLDQAIFIDTKC